MKELEKIKSRIQTRRGSNKDNELKIEDLEKKYSGSSKTYKISMCILVIMALFLSFMVYAKKDEEGKFLRNTLGINTNFTSFNKTINKLINFRTFDSFNSTSDVVSNIPNYIHMGEDLYVNGSSEVKSIDDGIVTYIFQDLDGYLVIVENDSGFRAVYSGLVDINVQINDRMYFDSVIGVVDEKVKIVFSKDNQIITYEQVLELL